MRIIENNQQEYECTCSNCKSKLAYVNSDVWFRGEEYHGELHSYSYVRCPVCSMKIILEVN